MYAPRTLFIMQLQKFMLEAGLSDAEVGRKINRNRATVSRYRRGKLVPDWPTIRRIKELSGGTVTERDWATIAEARLQNGVACV